MSLRAERDRYREALEHIGRHAIGGCDPECTQRMARIARAALEATDG